MLFTPPPLFNTASGLQTFIEMLTDLSLTSGLILCLDIGDSNCYSGSGQSVNDTSGAGNDYYLGSTSGSDSDDPTFVGTAGDLLEGTYFSSDGGDRFTPQAAFSEPGEWHKDNAVYTVVSVFYNVAAESGNNGLWGTKSGADVGATGSSPNSGGTDGELQLQVRNDSGNALNVGTAATKDGDDWNYFAWSFDEAVGSNGLNIQIGSTSELFTSTYTTPSTNAAEFDLRIFDGSNALASNGTRLGVFAAWDGVALTATNISDIRTKLLTRWTGI